MSESQPTIPLLVMWQRALRIRQCMNQEQGLPGTVYEASEAQDMTTQLHQRPTTGEQALLLLCEREQALTGEWDAHVWWEEFAQETDWAQWNDDEEWTNWYKH